MDVFNKDSMTPAERGAAIAKGMEADRLPCNPNVANGSSKSIWMQNL